MSKPISDYALLSNCRLSALVSRDGSIDWLCLPEPDGPPLFWSLLDDDRGGFWRVWLEGATRVTRRYLPGTVALETEHEGPGGVLRVTDVLQVNTAEDDEMHPDHELTRRIECVRGEVEARIELRPRPHFGRTRPRLRRMGHGVDIDADNLSVLVASDVDLHCDGSGGVLRGRARLRAGERRWVALGHTMDGPQIWPMLGGHADNRSDRTIGWWRSWSGACALPGVHDEMVLRSALTLQAMTYPPTGAIVAAPTTSLPEQIGGERNWDYRYCWIRDASFVMRAMLNLQNTTEAEGFFSWLLYATRLTWPELRVMYDVHGRPAPREREIQGVAGYEGSAPVRVGNGARHQLQLDTYGSLLDAAWMFHKRGGHISHAGARMLRGFVRTACRQWEEPDAGIWEIRAEPRHHTLSKAMCWVAMDRGLRLSREGVLDLDEERLRGEMDRVRSVVRERGFCHKTGSYAATLDGEAVDASLLLLGVFGFEDPGSARMNGTIDHVYERLGDGGALFRYLHTDDGLRGKEGRFGICGFWGVQALAAAGRAEEASRYMEGLLGHANDVGLLAEEIDVRDGRALGNFPQALTHLGLINAACALHRAEEGVAASPEAEGVC